MKTDNWTEPQFFLQLVASISIKLPRDADVTGTGTMLWKLVLGTLDSLPFPQAVYGDISYLLAQFHCTPLFG